ncbi:hypothetical protein QS468_47935 [Bacillus subtilis]|nr:hypothetical protein [Pseudomonas sp. A29(2023)]MDL5600512.1 hypothetical protein [Bacillus subtilis]
MSYTIEASGSATFNTPKGLVIDAAQLSYPTYGTPSDQRYDEDDIQNTATFTTRVGTDLYTWIVHFTEDFGTSRITIDDVIRSFPPGTDLEQDFFFSPRSDEQDEE